MKTPTMLPTPPTDFIVLQTTEGVTLVPISGLEPTNQILGKVSVRAEYVRGCLGLEADIQPTDGKEVTYLSPGIQHTGEPEVLVPGGNFFAPADPTILSFLGWQDQPGIFPQILLRLAALFPQEEPVPMQTIVATA